MIGARRGNARLLRGLVLLLAASLVLVAPAAQEKTSDQKIAFYRARIGGPGTYPAHARLGLAYLQKFRETGKTQFYDRALCSLNQSLTYQRNYEALLGLGQALAERHHFKEALPLAQEAVAAMPSSLEASGAVFDILLALGNLAEAEVILNNMLRLEEGFQAHSRLAALREYRGDYAGALEAMLKARDEASRTFPRAMVAWAETRVGSLHLAQCEPDQAREAYHRSLALDPGNFFANEHLAEWHAARGQWREARKLFGQLLKARPEPLYRIGLAEACRELGEKREPRRQIEKALAELRRSAGERSQDPFRSLALLLSESPSEQSQAEALRWAQRDWEVRQDATAADTLAWAHHVNGHGLEALELSRRALQSGSKQPALLLHGGLIERRWGDPKKGRALLQQAEACPATFGPHERKVIGMME